MALPTCECVKGLPIGEQLAAIYCATYTLAAGDVDGPYLLKSANLGDVDDATASRENIEAAGSPSGFASFIGQTAPRDYTLPDADGYIATSVLKIKGGDTSRSNTDTPTDDPDLVAVIEPGTYVVEIGVVVSCATVDPGFRMQLASSGGSAQAAGSIQLFSNVAGQISNGIAPNETDPNLIGILVASNAISPAIRYGGQIQFSLVVSATTTLSLQWAQMTVDSDNTTLKAGSFMQINRYS